MRAVVCNEHGPLELLQVADRPDPVARPGCAVVDVAYASRLPAIAEPFFLHFNASVSFHPCITPEDLGKAGLDEIGKKYR